MPLGTDYSGQDCSLARALELVGERWTMLILRDCFLGVRRFSDLQAHLDISRAVLSQRLGQLVADGLLQRTDDPHAHAVLRRQCLDLSLDAKAVANDIGKFREQLGETAADLFLNQHGRAEKANLG